MALQSLCPVAKSELTSHCQGPVRADIVGLLTYVEIAPTAKPKATLKDESKEEIAIRVWGSRMVSAARDMKVGQLAQIDNCLLHKKLDGSVEGSCLPGLRPAQLQPPDHRCCGRARRALAAARLRQGPRHFHAVEPAGRRAANEDGRLGEARVLRSDRCRAEAAVEVVLHGIWVTNVHGSPLYTL